MFGPADRLLSRLCPLPCRTLLVCLPRRADPRGRIGLSKEMCTFVSLLLSQYLLLLITPLCQILSVGFSPNIIVTPFRLTLPWMHSHQPSLSQSCKQALPHLDFRAKMKKGIRIKTCSSVGKPFIIPCPLVWTDFPTES